MMKRLTHISFATWQMSDAAEDLVASAYAHGVDNVWVYSPSHPAIMQAITENPEITNQTRGAGYWIWKAYVLLDAMTHLADGEMLFYTDAGISYIDDPRPIFALAEQRDIVLFNFTGLPGTHRHRTKRDTLVLLGADNPQHWDERVVEAGLAIFRVNRQTRSFVREWRDAMRDPRVLTDMPNSSGLENFPEFEAHMHDMSVMTVLATRRGIPRTRFPGIPPRPEDEGDYPQVFYRHALRSPGAPRHVSLAAAVDIARREAMPAFLHGGSGIDRELISARARDIYQRWKDRERVLPADFDPKTYLALHPDVAESDLDPARHYLEWGKQERLYRLPADFEDAEYLRLNPDVARSEMNPGVHYASCGHREGRRYRIDRKSPAGSGLEGSIAAALDRLPPDFDDAVYLRLHPDVAEAGMNARYHYLTFGCREGRRYSEQRT